MQNLNWEKTRIKRQIKFQGIRTKFHDISGFGIILKIAVDPKDTGLTITELHHRCFPWKFTRFWEVLLDGGFQSYHTDKNISKLPLKSPIKKEFSKTSQNSQKKHFCRGIFFNKDPDCGLQTLLKRDSSVGVFFVNFPKFWKTITLETSVNGSFWRVRTFRVFFVKFQVFTMNTNVFHVFPWKFLNVYIVIFENSSNWLFLKMFLQTKSCLKSTTKIALKLRQWILFGYLNN